MGTGSSVEPLPPHSAAAARSAAPEVGEAVCEVVARRLQGLDESQRGRVAALIQHHGLDGDHAVDLGILAEIDDAHRTAAELF